MITKFKLFENIQLKNIEIKILTKELMVKHIDEICEMNKNESERNPHFLRWYKNDFLMSFGLKNKWKYSLIVFLDGKVIGFQINNERNGISVVHTNKLLVDKKYRNYYIFWEIHKKLFSLIKENGIDYWTCFTPFENVKNMYVELLGAKTTSDVEPFFDKETSKYYKIKKIDGDKLYFEGCDNEYYFLVKKV